jgi:hypothetical protein
MRHKTGRQPIFPSIFPVRKENRPHGASRPPRLADPPDSR